MYRITKKELVDSIAIPIMNLGKNIVMSHKVKLSRPSLDGGRDYFHKEFTYRSKYKDPPRVSTLRLTHSSILTIENKSSEGMESLIINIGNRDFIVKSLSLIKPILEQDDLFIEHDDKFIVNPKLRPDSKISFEPYRNKTVTIKPCVITYDDEARDAVEGVAVSLDSRSGTNIEIPVDVFMVIIKIIKKFDFHVAGLAALTYLQSAEIGKHEIDMVKLNISDFDTDLQPEFRGRKGPPDSVEGKLEVRKHEPPSKNKGW